MDWLILHYPSLIAHTLEDPAFLPYVHRYENSDWTSYYMSSVCKALWSHQCYQKYRSFFEFPDGNYDDSFRDVHGPDGYTILSFGYFGSLVNIHSCHLVYHQGMTCHMKPYLPSQFVRQLGYIQLYEGNRI